MNLAGINTLIMGPAGTGKTTSIGTAVDSGLEVFYLTLEAGIDPLLDYWLDRNLPIPKNLHWHVLSPATASITELIDSARKVNTLTFESITKMADPNRTKYNQFIGLLENLNNFTDQKGEKFGAVNTWEPDRILVIDGLTGLNNAAMSMVIGGKPVKNQADWGVAQDQVYKILELLTGSCRCHFILIAHVERETDQVLGGVKLTVSTLGRALAPKIPPLFSDVILTVKEGKSFYWDTASPQADVKTRNLKIESKLPPSFKPILDRWTSRCTKTNEAIGGK